MFSSRIPWDLPQNRFSRALAEKRARGKTAALLDLCESNPTRVGILPLEDADLLAPLADPRGLRYEPAPRGHPEARQAVSRYYRQRAVPLDVDPEHLVLCASTSEAYAWLFQLLCDPGDAVLYPQPSYPLFAHLAGLSAVRLLPYPLEYDGRWRIDLHALAAGCTESTRAVLVVNPNNPTGSYVDRADLDALHRLCRERGLCLIADEVFADYPLAAPRPDRVPALSIPGGPAPVLTFVLSGLSKVLGLPQLKLGWIHVGGPEPLRSTAQERLELIADTFLSVSTPVQRAAPALLARQPELQRAILDRVAGNRQRLEEAVRGSPVQLLHVEGGWYGVLRLPRLLPEEEWVLDLLAQEDVVVYPGYFFDFPEEAYVVVSLLPRPEVLSEGARRLLRCVATAEGGC